MRCYTFGNYCEPNIQEYEYKDKVRNLYDQSR